MVFLMMKKLIYMFIGIAIGFLIVFAILVNTATFSEAAQRTYSVHLASYNKISDLMKGWQKLVEGHTRYLGGLTPTVSKFVINTDKKKRTYYRLKAGSFPTRIIAIKFCNTLKDRGLDCIVKRSSGKRLKSY